MMEEQQVMKADVKEGDAGKYIEGVGAAWFVDGVETVIFCKNEDDLAEVIKWLGLGDVDPFLLRDLDMYDRGLMIDNDVPSSSSRVRARLEGKE
jgi:hypothetical protein